MQVSFLSIRSRVPLAVSALVLSAVAASAQTPSLDIEELSLESLMEMRITAVVLVSGAGPPAVTGPLTP